MEPIAHEDCCSTKREPCDCLAYREGTDHYKKRSPGYCCQEHERRPRWSELPARTHNARIERAQKACDDALLDQAAPDDVIELLRGKVRATLESLKLPESKR